MYESDALHLKRKQLLEPIAYIVGKGHAPRETVERQFAARDVIGNYSDHSFFACSNVLVIAASLCGY